MSGDHSLQATVVRGGFWISLGFASQQALSVARTFVLARLLTPEDFGIMGFTVLVLFAGEILTDLNISAALIQKPRLSKQFCDNAWSLSLIKGGLLAAALIGLAPFIAEKLRHFELIPYLQVGAISFLLVSAPAVPAALLIRDLRYRDHVLLSMAREVAVVSLSIALGVCLKNAWALLLGLLGGQLVFAGGIWFVGSYKPKWLLDKESFRETWQFGMPLYISGLMTYVVTRGDDLVVSRLRGIAALGQYQVVFNIAEMLTRGLSDVIARVVFPAYARMVGQGRDLCDGFDEVWRVSVLMLLPITGILVVLPSEIIQILLGNQWVNAASALALLAIGETLRALAVPFGSIIVASGRTRSLSRLKLVEAAIFCAVIIPFTQAWGLSGAAGSLILTYSYALAGAVYVSNRITPIMEPLISGLAEPLLATLIIGAAVAGIPRPGVLMTIMSLTIWGLLWGLYILFRHRDLLSKFVHTFKRDGVPARD
jgi:lipopolysaccharide exporter